MTFDHAIIFGGAVILGLLIWVSTRLNEPPEEPQPAPAKHLKVDAAKVNEYHAVVRILSRELGRVPTAAEIRFYMRAKKEIRQLTRKV